MGTYSEKLRDPRWQKARSEILRSDNWACVACTDATSTLNVHHCFYTYGNDPWDYPATSLITLCETCHQYETENARRARDRLYALFARQGKMVDDINYFCETFEQEDNRQLLTLIIGWLASDRTAQALIDHIVQARTEGRQGGADGSYSNN